MKRANAVAIFTLLILLGELFDPSSNFVRVASASNSSSRARLMVAHSNPSHKFHLNYDSHDEQDNKDNDDHSTMDDMGTHCAYPAATFVFEILEFETRVIFFFHQNPPDDYHPPIFQPPKIA